MRYRVAQFHLHKALDETRPLLRAGHPATDATEPAVRSPKQDILNATLPILKLTLSESRETISTLIHALMRRPAARKLRSKPVVFGQAQSRVFNRALSTSRIACAAVRTCSRSSTLAARSSLWQAVRASHLSALTA